MMKRKLLLIASLFTLCAGLFAKGDTYIYDYWGKMEKSPDAYRVSHVVYADDLKLQTALKNPTSLFAFNNLLYVVDGHIIEFFKMILIIIIITSIIDVCR